MVQRRAHSAEPRPAAWSLLARPARWHEWAPHVRGAWGLGEPEVRVGARGAARLLGVVPVPATVITAKVDGRSWTWRVGPVDMVHAVRPAAGGLRRGHRAARAGAGRGRCSRARTARSSGCSCGGSRSWRSVADGALRRRRASLNACDGRGRASGRVREAQAPPLPVKPRLRGVSHQWAFFVSLVLGAVARAHRAHRRGHGRRRHLRRLRGHAVRHQRAVPPHQLAHRLGAAAGCGGWTTRPSSC